MTEKDMFLNTWQREFATTFKILKQLPPDKANFKPAADKTKSAKDLATMFIAELGVADGVVKGKVMDSVHHRGQFSVYLRLVGAKVPSIYGPSGDEPWT